MIQEVSASNLSLTRDCAFSFFKESKLPGNFNWDHWKASWEQIIGKGMGLIFAYFPNEEDKKIGGVLGGIAAHCLNTGDLEIFETFWYMLPEHRGTPAAIRLLRAFELWGEKIGAKRVKMAYLREVNGETVRNMYERLGYNEQETTFRKEISEP